MAASAGYALASGASRILVSPSSAVGSIGIVALHMDVSARLSQAGIRPTLIHAGARKADRSAMVPLTTAARDGLQAEVDQLYGMFVDLVARHRSMPASAVRATEAGMFTGQAAVKAKLADAIGSLDDAIAAIAVPVPLAMVTRMSSSTPSATPVIDPHRLAAILAMPEAKGLEAEARDLAPCAMSLAAIRATLAEQQKAAAVARQATADASWNEVVARMGTGPVPPVASPTSPAGSWGNVAAAVNTEFGRTQRRS